MPVVLDYRCPKCDEIVVDTTFRTTPNHVLHWPCRTEMVWHPTARRRSHAEWQDRDAIVVYEDPRTGKVFYPGRNDEPMPARYRKAGYVRKEMRSMQAVQKFEKEHGVRSEVAWFDRNGRGHDNYDPPPLPSLDGITVGVGRSK